MSNAFTARCKGAVVAMLGAVSMVIAVMIAVSADAGERDRNDDSLSQTELAYQELLSRNFEAAELRLEATVAEHPDNPFALLNLAYVYKATGREGDAAAVYRRILELDANPLAAVSSGHGDRVKYLAKQALADLEN